MQRPVESHGRRLYVYMYIIYALEGVYVMMWWSIATYIPRYVYIVE